MIASGYKLKGFAFVILGMILIAQVPSVDAAAATIGVTWAIPPSIGSLPAGRSFAKGTLKICKGDTVTFRWSSNHGVSGVAPAKYKTCNAAGAKVIAAVSGSGSKSVKPSGQKYYICPVPGHCTSGQKLKIVAGPAC